MHVAGDDRRQLRVGVGDVGHAGAGALVLVVDAHMRHQHDGVDLAVDCLMTCFTACTGSVKFNPLMRSVPLANSAVIGVSMPIMPIFTPGVRRWCRPAGRACRCPRRYARQRRAFELLERRSQHR